MVKDSPLYAVLPLNFGSRVVELTDWITNGSQLGSTHYLAAAAATVGTMGIGYYYWNNLQNKITSLVDPYNQTRILNVCFLICSTNIFMRKIINCFVF